MLSRDDYVFFWKINEVHGWGSQWYYSPFKAKIRFEEGKEQEEVEFLTAEHWMMVQKSLLFKDAAVAQEILSIKEVNQSSMTEVKGLGRKVSDFNEDKWVKARDRIVLEGSLHKFRQNKELKDNLLATGNKTIVEASPRDRIWGVGFGEKNALNQKERWGLNLLGKALEEARRILREEDAQAEEHE
ncbi:hypothetical protein CPB83DRAFT_875287 [Crepidotus variabilis]|uniref:NADAR domain-containing protein n=1 Tax=Crepidotus variabilis TaxID=179855 RepID=A0A9P6JRR6_9AGAR|nr:hypothetical protein CPB83DRAFT_875287 [Crepidotus variabilis]